MNEEYVSEFDRQKMGDIVAGHGDWFSAYLFRLCAKADRDNLERLSYRFPLHVKAFLEWREGRS